MPFACTHDEQAEEYLPFACPLEHVIDPLLWAARNMSLHTAASLGLAGLGGKLHPLRRVIRAADLPDLLLPGGTTTT